MYKHCIYTEIKLELKTMPKKLVDLDKWLFVAVNTAKSIIDNSCRNDSGAVIVFTKCSSVAQIQYEFDKVQGRYGRENFSQRYSPVYLYLCSLVADFPDTDISAREVELIKEYVKFDKYLLYEL